MDPLCSRASTGFLPSSRDKLTWMHQTASSVAICHPHDKLHGAPVWNWRSFMFECMRFSRDTCTVLTELWVRMINIPVKPAAFVLSGLVLHSLNYQAFSCFSPVCCRSWQIWECKAEEKGKGSTLIKRRSKAAVSAANVTLTKKTADCRRESMYFLGNYLWNVSNCKLITREGENVSMWRRFMATWRFFFFRSRGPPLHRAASNHELPDEFRELPVWVFHRTLICQFFFSAQLCICEHGSDILH